MPVFELPVVAMTSWLLPLTRMLLILENCGEYTRNVEAAHPPATENTWYALLIARSEKRTPCRSKLADELTGAPTGKLTDAHGSLAPIRKNSTWAGELTENPFVVTANTACFQSTATAETVPNFLAETTIGRPVYGGRKISTFTPVADG